MTYMLIHAGFATLFLAVTVAAFVWAFRKPRRWFIRLPVAYAGVMMGLGTLGWLAIVGVDVGLI